jgi:hypothetical protein
MGDKKGYYKIHTFGENSGGKPFAFYAQTKRKVLLNFQKILKIVSLL